MLEISQEFLKQLVSFYLNETCQSLQDILWTTVGNSIDQLIIMNDILVLRNFYY